MTLGHLAVALALSIVGWFAYASRAHFDRSGPEPPGASLISIMTAAATALNVLAWYRGARGGDGAALAAIALGLASAAVFYAATTAAPKRHLSLAFSDRTPDALVDGGIYARVRNPLYLAYMIYWLLWIPLTGAHWLSVAAFAVMALTYVLAVRREERLLTERMGDSYRAYAARTKRLIPGIF